MAHFDQKDVRGDVTFEQANMTANLTIKFNFLTGLRSFNRIEFLIRENPSVYDHWCKHTGKTIYNMSTTHGYINENSYFVDDYVMIMGRMSVFGRSLSLYENGTCIACATILPPGDVIYANAHLHSREVGGDFTFITAKTGGDTFIHADLYHVSSAPGSHNFYISADTADHKTCQPLNQMYNPKESSGNCTKHQESNCKIGDLSSKHGTLEFVNGEVTISGVDTMLPLSGDYSIISRYVVVKRVGENRVVACAKINIAGPLDAISMFKADKNKGVYGHLKFFQQSPYHPTYVDVKLDGLAERANGYHVHQFPISDFNNPCSGSSVGGHVNTWLVDKNTSPLPSENGSLDRYEVGDLSGRYGGLRGKNSTVFTKKDANLPLYGRYTLLGRSIVLHEDKAGAPRFVCADVEPNNYKLKVSTTTTFGGNSSIGARKVKTCQWIQRNGIITRTTIVVDVPEGDTKGHIWGIHAKPIPPDGTCPGYDSTDNPLYNPRNLNGTFCDKTRPFLCKIGDISSVVGRFDLTNGKTFYSDENLPMLAGPVTILGRSLVMYKSNGSHVPLACGNIVPDAGRLAAKLTFFVQNKTYMDRTSELHQMLVDGFEFPQSQAYRINSLTTSLLQDDDDRDCFKVDFVMVDINSPPRASSYKCTLDEILESPTKMGTFKRCESNSSAINVTPSSSVAHMLSTEINATPSLAPMSSSSINVTMSSSAINVTPSVIMATALTVLIFALL